MDFEQILALIDHVSGSKLTAFTFEEGNLKLSMQRGSAAGAFAQKAKLEADGCADGAQEDAETDGKETQAQGKLVRSLLVGTFYEAPSEEAAPFVKPGDQVKKGQVLAIVEAMKLMNEVESDYEGTVAEVLVKNGDAVEYGQPLFRII